MSNKESAIDALVALGVPLTLSTGLSGADAILGNVLQYGKISQIAGESGVGKTQVSFRKATSTKHASLVRFCAHFFAPKNNHNLAYRGVWQIRKTDLESAFNTLQSDIDRIWKGHDKLCYAVVARFLLCTKFSVAWFDSNGSFQAHRLRQFILGLEEIDDDAVESLLERVAVTRIADHLELVEALELVDDYFEEYCIRLLVIDNISEMMDERLLDENMTRTAIMTVITNRINNLANIGCTVILTSCTVQEDDEKNELYRSWVQQMHGRVILRKEKGDVRTVCSSKVSNDCSLGYFKITRDGLQNVNFLRVDHDGV